MGRGKRKKAHRLVWFGPWGRWLGPCSNPVPRRPKSNALDGCLAQASPAGSQPKRLQRELEGREDLNQSEIVSGESVEGRDTSTYLVACHWDWARSPKPFCVYKIVDAALSDASSVPPARTKGLKLLRHLETDAGGKVFTSVRSKHRAWIVGVGGNHGDTVIFNTKTKKVIHGPKLISAKWCPVLTSVGDKVYAMSKCPSWVSEPDFPPWFEVLDLSKAKVVTVDGRSHLEGCSWSDLPNPPCIPWELTPTDYTMLPIVILMSHVVVRNYILVSFNKPWGTYALDTNAHEPEWHKVDNKRLPFFGCAAPLRSGSFIGLSQERGPISAYRIDVTTADKDNALKLSIAVLPVKYMERQVDTGSCFSSLDNGFFCSLGLLPDSRSLTLNPEHDELIPRKVHVNLTTYQIENPSLLDPEESLRTVNPEIAISSKWEQFLCIASSEHGFSPFAFAFLSV